MKHLKWIIAAALVLFWAGVLYFDRTPGPRIVDSVPRQVAPVRHETTRSTVPAVPSGNDAQVVQAFRGRKSGIGVTGAGVVSRVLPDDNDGSRHQKFILDLPSGGTLLIAHNIDIAPRINALRAGDLVEFCGLYEWNDKGGVVHWTHRDPKGRHSGGWLRHGGQIYK